MRLPSRHARVCPTAAAVLVASGDYARGLCDPDPDRQDLVHSPVWRMTVYDFELKEDIL